MPWRQVLCVLSVALPLIAVDARLGGLNQGASALADAVTNSTAAGLSVAVGDSGAEARQLATKLEKNLALYSPVEMSTIASFDYNGGDDVKVGLGIRMTDGDTGTQFFFGGGCAQTQYQADPWARIDFGREVPTALVQMSTRSDSDEPGLGPINVYVGSNKGTWRENLPCAEGIQLSRDGMTSKTCLGIGRYMFVVLRARGTLSKPLSLCEVQVVPKGPLGTTQVLQTAGEMWNLKLAGLAMSAGDRIRIVKDNIWCGEIWSSYMDQAVLSLTAPMGGPDVGSFSEEEWHNILISTMGVYKVCWCGNIGGCTTDEHFSMEVARIVINGIMMTVAGDGTMAANPTYPDLVEQGTEAISTPLRDPYGLAVGNGRVFVSENRGNRVRYINLATGLIYGLSGQGRDGFANGDGGAALNAELWGPRGLGLSPDMGTLYVADARNHRVRSIRLSVDADGLLGSGKIITVAGNGFMGFSGDGGPASDAQLNMPSCAQVDLNDMLWICDFNNNRVRVVSLGKEVRIPGTNEFAKNIILTAAGTGLTGITGDRGDGGPSVQAQVGGPLALAISAGYVGPEDGVLPASVYIAEDKTHTVRTIGLDLRSYLGVISALAGTDDRCLQLPCDALTEAVPNEAVMAELDAPAGIATQDGLVYISDTRNNRILLTQRLEYMSIGCWRENTESPWIPSIEPDDGGASDEFLNGPPEQRKDAIRKCAYAALSRGFSVFAVRRMGACATGREAHVQYKNEGASTSCSNGLGGARDNSVYKFTREGGMVQMAGLIYKLSGREGRAGFTGDTGTAWVSELDGPTGIAVNPDNKDIWISDTGNQRLRMIFNMIGPMMGHSVRCTNGMECLVDLTGNGLQPNNYLAVMPIELECGSPGMDFSEGFERNPVTEIPSPSFTEKTYSFGIPSMKLASSYRLCFCIKDSVLFGKTIACVQPEDFVQDAGVVHISGPDSSIPLVARAGVPFDLPIYGLLLSQFDRIRIVDDTQVCGLPGAEVTVNATVNADVMVNYQRSLGNVSWCMWRDVVMTVAGQYKVCW